MQGIYTIRNILTGALYVGSALCIEQRLNRHKYTLKKNMHHNKHLQNAYNKYGETAFVFQPEELVEDKQDLITTEQQWMNTLSEFPLYNICKVAGSCLGNKHSEATRLKQSKARLGKKPGKLSEAGRQKIIATHTGRKMSDKNREHLRLINSMNVMTQEQKDHLRVLNTGKVKSEETKQKISNAMKGKTISDEHRANLCKAQKGHSTSEEARVKMRASHIGHKATEETKAKMKASQLKRYRDKLYLREASNDLSSAMV